MKKDFTMPDHLGDDMRKIKAEEKEEEIKSELIADIPMSIADIHLNRSRFLINLLLLFNYSGLDEGDILLLKTYVSDCHFFISIVVTAVAF